MPKADFGILPLRYPTMSIAKKAILLLIVGSAVLLAAQEPVREFAVDCVCSLCLAIHSMLGIS